MHIQSKFQSIISVLRESQRTSSAQRGFIVHDALTLRWTRKQVAITSLGQYDVNLVYQPDNTPIDKIPDERIQQYIHNHMNLRQYIIKNKDGGYI